MEGNETQQRSPVDALDGLRRALRQLHRQAGEPSTREIARQASKPISHTTVSEVLRCQATPKWGPLETVVTVLTGDPALFKELWLEVREAEQLASHGSGTTTEADKREIVVHLARRNQILVGQLIEFLEREFDGFDCVEPAQVRRLMEMANRIRRNDQALLTVADHESTKGIRRPITPLMDVLRKEVELRQAGRTQSDPSNDVESHREEPPAPRVQAGVDSNLDVAGHAVHDVGLLIGELLDNALNFSPPDTMVSVTVQRGEDSLALVIEDSGIGLSLDQLARVNERLARPPSLDVKIFRTMGLAVVARLASRHRLSVALRQSPSGGTIAEIAFPNDVVLVRARGRDTRPAMPDQKVRESLAVLSPEQASALLACLSQEQVRAILAGRAADRAQAVLDQSRSAGWPIVSDAPAVERPGWPHPARDEA